MVNRSLQIWTSMRQRHPAERVDVDDPGRGHFRPDRIDSLYACAGERHLQVEGPACQVGRETRNLPRRPGKKRWLVDRREVTRCILARCDEARGRRAIL